MVFPINIYTEYGYKVILNEEEFRHFATHYKIIYAAGGIVSNISKEVLMIYRRDTWDFPKGKIEQRERKDMAALREVTEETGIDELSIISELPSTFHIYKEKNILVLKHTFWFKMFAESKKNPVPQTEEEITEALWCPIDEVSILLENSYPSLIDLWRELYHEKS